MSTEGLEGCEQALVTDLGTKGLCAREADGGVEW